MTLRTALVIDGDASGATQATAAAAGGLGRLDAATDAATAALRANTAAQTANNAAVRQGLQQRANLIFQLNDIFVSLASGMNPAMVAIQQGSQISTIYGPGGLGKALSETGKIATGLVTRFWPLAAAVGVVSAGLAGLQKEINRTGTGIEVSFGDTALAVLQTFADYVWDVVGPAVTAIGTWFDDTVWPVIVKGTADTVNVLVRGWMGFMAELELIGTAITHIFDDTWVVVQNSFVDFMQVLTDSVMTDVNALRRAFGQEPIEVKLDFLRAEGKDGWSADAVDRFNRRLSDINTTDYAGKLFGDIADHARQNALADEDKAKKAKISAYEREIGAIRERTAAMEVEAGVIGLSTFAAERMRKILELETAARKDAIGLTPRRIAEIEREATAYARMAATLEQTRALYDLGKSALNGFFADMASGLRDGVSLWDAFGNAAGNAFDRIADKALGAAADGLWDLLFGAIRGGITGGFGGASLLGSGSAASIGAGLVGRNARGTRNWRGGPTWVGEEGPEIVNLPAGSQVYSAGESRAMAGGVTFAPVSNFSVTGGEADFGAYRQLLDERDRALRGQFEQVVAGYLANPLRRSA